MTTPNRRRTPAPQRWVPEPERAARYLKSRDIPCPGCGYLMRGLESARCPECGREIDAATLIAQAVRAHDEQSPSYRRLRIVVGVIAGLIAGAAAWWLLW